MSEILGLVQGSLDPQKYAELNWEGSYRDYLELVGKDPAVDRKSVV